MRERRARLGQVLERVPEHDRRLRLGHVGEVAVAALEALRRPAAGAQRGHERPVAGPDVEHRPRRGELVDAGGEARAQAAQQRVARAGEAAGVRAVPGRVGGVELLRRRERVRGGDPARSADGAPAEPARAAVERGAAPAAVGRRAHAAHRMGRVGRVR